MPESERTITRTIDQATLEGGGASLHRPIPGVLLVFSADEPLLAPLPLIDGALMIGRGRVGDATIQDGCMSRNHARVAFDGARWTITDLGSRNGTRIDGERLTGARTLDAPRVLRLGDSLFLPRADVSRFIGAHVEVSDDKVVGPALRAALEAIRLAAAHGDVLHITGESGSGKELAARAFHDFRKRSKGAFVAVNCAAIPEGVAERLLFGAKKGAFSGADADAEGYVEAADGGTLFLDEIGELELAVQAKLLRVLESREVLPLGSTRPRKVELHLCSATHRPLRARVTEKRFREDLYYRVGRPEVALPPLRARMEEIPHLAGRELHKAGKLAAHASLIESCLLRPWPGNVRELLVEIRAAARSAMAAGEARVDATHLSPTAGTSLSEPAPPLSDVPEEEDSRGPAVLPSREVIQEALRQEKGRVASAARVLGVHRTQLRRWLTKNGIDPRTFGDVT